MERRWDRIVVGLVLIAVVGCGSSSSTTPSPSPSAAAAVPSDPAARTAYEFLDAVVKGDTARANALLTPLAVERIQASGKPFQLPGLENYRFQVGQVRQPVEDKAFVQCTGTDISPDGKTIEEEFCWLMSRVDSQWRVAGISYSAGPQQTLMIYSFEEPEKGAVPVQQLMARAANTAPAAGGRPSPQPLTQSPQQGAYSSPHSAQEAIPAAAYR